LTECGRFDLGALIRCEKGISYDNPDENSAAACGRPKLLRHFWHPVCTLSELEQSNAAGVGPLGRVLLDESVVIAKLMGKIVALQECRQRCPRQYRLPRQYRQGDEDNGGGVRYHLRALPKGIRQQGSALLLTRMRAQPWGAAGQSSRDGRGRD
jgi:hypothetical protein